MKLDPSTLSTLPGLGAGEARLASFSGGDAWADNLTLGQILKGKVLRSYGEGRYAVDFGGQERIVDSGVPLAMGDVLRGRIVCLSQRVTVGDCRNAYRLALQLTRLPYVQPQQRGRATQFSKLRRNST